MTFKIKYTEEDFLKVLKDTSIYNAKSTATVEKGVGCAKSTAKLFLAQLEQAGRIKSIIVEGTVCGWYIV